MKGSTQRFRALVAVAVCAVLVVGCGETQDEGTTDGNDLCPERADFWVAIQQDYLDRLGDASVAELEARSDRVDQAGRWAGNAILEYVREVDSVGCAAAVRMGAPLICDRIDQLEAGGSAASSVIDGFRESCGP